MINDDSIEKLLPEWSIQLSQLADPVKENVRQLGLAKLLHSYGGVIIPDSTIMLRNMENIHKEKLSRNDMYVGELINRNSSSVSHRFFPSHKLMGCKKESKSMKELIENLPEFGLSAKWNFHWWINSGKVIIGTQDGFQSIKLLDNWLSL